MPVLIPSNSWTPLQLIREALGLSNAVGVDQTLTAQETTDCFVKFNDIQEDWSNQSLMMYAAANQSFLTIANQAMYTIGPGGNWNAIRPIRINSPAIATYQGVNFPVYPWDVATYNLVSLPNQPQPFPTNYVYENTFPLGQITLWPMPNDAITMTFSIDTVLGAAATAATQLSFPPGYRKLFVYQLCIECSPLFGKTAPPNVEKTFITTMANIKRANKRTPTSQFDPSLQGGTDAVIWQRGW